MSSILSQWVKEGVCATSGILAKHTSFVPKNGNFENQQLSRKPIEQKDAQFRCPEIGRECMCNFWNFGPWPSWLLSREPRPMGLLF